MPLPFFDIFRTFTFFFYISWLCHNGCQIIRKDWLVISGPLNFRIFNQNWMVLLVFTQLLILPILHRWAKAAMTLAPTISWTLVKGRPYHVTGCVSVKCATPPLGGTRHIPCISNSNLSPFRQPPLAACHRFAVAPSSYGWRW
jgi:hypothetical protein